MTVSFLGHEGPRSAFSPFSVLSYISVKCLGSLAVCSRKNKKKYIRIIFPEMEVSCAPLRCYVLTETVLCSSVQFSSVAQSCLTLCDPLNCSTPGLPVHHHLLEFTQTHVYRVCDAIQPSHPGSSLSPPVPNPSQHQSLFQ